MQAAGAVLRTLQIAGALERVLETHRISVRAGAVWPGSSKFQALQHEVA
jgi:hypothetical protein